MSTPISIKAIFLAFLKLGLTAFGGPVAHLGYFREEFVARRRWLTDETYADMVALCQFLPGPASSQVGIAIGLAKGGYKGALAAWLGFTLPSVILLLAAALFIAGYSQSEALTGAIHGLKIVAVAVVANACWQMGRQLCPDRLRQGIMVGVASLVLMFPSAAVQLLAIGVGALIGRWLVPASLKAGYEVLLFRGSYRVAVVSICALVILLLLLPLLAAATSTQWVDVADVFVRIGAIVFGGGHVVLPLLQSEVVSPGWISPDAFLAGYGLTQAVPGPLFTFAAFIGASMEGAMSGWLGALIATVAIFLPSFLLVFAALPFWDRMRRSPAAQSALMGVNAAVVGLLLAALYDPVWITSIETASDFAAFIIAFAALTIWRWPPWAVVILGAGLGSAAAVALLL